MRAPGREFAAGDRRRLGTECARLFGLIFVAASLLNLIVPNLGRLPSYLPAVLGLLCVAAGFAQLGRGRARPPGRRRDRLGLALCYLACLGTLASFLLPGVRVDDVSTLATVTMLASMVTPSLLLGIGHRRDLPLLALAGFLPVLALAALPVLATQSTGRVVLLVVAVLGGWLALFCAAVWLARSAQRAADGIESLRTAHDVERRSTDAEAELRSGARMVHDTVLSTLTLIAHSGEGVRPEELRAQARADGVLLGELRTHGVAVHRSAPESRRAAGASPADASWSAVDSWHSAHGLSITWHGADQLDLPADRLDALVRAASECLENVRRHSGVSKADVMLSQDARMARAVVTDSGVGFVRKQVPGDRLGVAQSIEARVHAVGGTARIFTSPGRGTTVLLEVPR